MIEFSYPTGWPQQPVEAQRDRDEREDRDRVEKLDERRVHPAVRDSVRRWPSGSAT